MFQRIIQFSGECFQNVETCCLGEYYLFTAVALTRTKFAVLYLFSATFSKGSVSLFLVCAFQNGTIEN